MSGSPAHPTPARHPKCRDRRRKAPSAMMSAMGVNQEDAATIEAPPATKAASNPPPSRRSEAPAAARFKRPFVRAHGYVGQMRQHSDPLRQYRPGPTPGQRKRKGQRRHIWMTRHPLPQRALPANAIPMHGTFSQQFCTREPWAQRINGTNSALEQTRRIAACNRKFRLLRSPRQTAWLRSGQTHGRRSLG